MGAFPPLVLVHGLWDTPRLFDPLRADLRGARNPLLSPHLPHRLGATPLEQLAAELGRRIEAHFGSDSTLDLLGFSMGGVVARTWIQLFDGYRRTRRFISVASPQRGSWLALPWPRRPLAGIADMKPGSPLLERLDGDLTTLRQVECCSFYCPFDLTVVPGWQAVLPFGPRRRLPPLPHAWLMSRSSSRARLVAELLRP
jgi:triacylglycerol lipase